VNTVIWTIAMTFSIAGMRSEDMAKVNQ